MQLQLKYLLTTSVLPVLLIFGCLSCNNQSLGDEDIRFVITGNLMGAIKDCVCPHGQPGGLARRKSIFDQLKKSEKQAYYFDVGRLTSDDFTEDEAELLNRLLDELPYHYIICFPEDSIMRISHDTEKLKFHNNYTVKIPLRKRSISIQFSNLDEDEDEKTLGSEILKDNVLHIIGGGGYVETEVIEKDGTLTVYPGLYGEFVVVLDVQFNKHGEINNFAWEAMPTESVLPDSQFHSMIEVYYNAEDVDNAE